MPVRPVVKQSIPYFTADNAIHFRLAGTLISLEDADGRVLDLLKLLDGRHEQDAIWRELSVRYPDLTPDDVRDAICDLDENGLIQDSSDTGEDFDAAAKERWSRNLGFFETYASLAISKYEFQRRIRDAKIAVLGIGGRHPSGTRSGRNRLHRHEAGGLRHRGVVQPEPPGALR